MAGLERRFRSQRGALLARRVETRARLRADARLDFLAETEAIRARDWTVAPIPADLLDRRVEITGPASPKMVINALNSGASVFMADCEDSMAPTWSNVTGGQIALGGAVRRTLAFTQPDTGVEYRLGAQLATLLVRPRGWHLDEVHLEVDGAPISASLLDFGLYLFHNHAELRARGTGPYFYLPKLESHLEARLWNDVFVWAQDELGIARGTIRATVLIETLPAAFEMDEILWELREHSSGLNCGRWDYIFSTIKCNRDDPGWVLPDRGDVTMTAHFLRSYSRLAIRTCHRRGIHAIGGMAAQIPIKGDPAGNAEALEKVRLDKQREVDDGHDGTWVAHPALIPVAREVFDRSMPGSNQIARVPDRPSPSAVDLLTVPPGGRTEAGLRHNLDVGVLYLAAWLGGQGCVPIYHLMEDAATAEISRAQVWQQVRHRASLDDGRVIDADMVRAALAETLAAIRTRVGSAAFEAGRFELAGELLERLITAPELAEFLTSEAYPYLTTLSDRD